MIFVANQHSKLRFSRAETQRAVRSVLQQERKKRIASIAVVFVGSRFIRKMNKDFLGHDYVTDVISFPLQDGVGVDAEVYVNLDRAKSQAREYGVHFRDEVLRLVIHGTLHLLGYDDKKVTHKERMRRREDYHLARLT